MVTHEPVIVAFLCEWCAYRAADLMGVMRAPLSPGLAAVRVTCSGRVEPEMVLQALRGGADGVLVAGCPPGGCHFVDGNVKALRRLSLLREMLAQFGVEPKRVQFHWVSASDAHVLVGVVERMTAQLRALGPLRWGESVLGAPSAPDGRVPTPGDAAGDEAP